MLQNMSLKCNMLSSGIVKIPGKPLFCLKSVALLRGCCKEQEIMTCFITISLVISLQTELIQWTNMWKLSQINTA